MVAAAAAILAIAAAVPAQSARPAAFEVALADGRTWLATALVGDPLRDLVATVGGERRSIAAGQLLAVHGAAAEVVDLPSAWLAGGEVVRGAVVGGDDAGDRLDVLSPCLGRIGVPVDRLAAVAGPAVRAPLDRRLPDGKAEGIFLRAAVGEDLLVGSLHRFGDLGIAFQPDGERAPRWFKPQDVVALRIADAAPRGAVAPAWLVTRTGDLLGVRVVRFGEGSVRCELETGAAVELRVADLACLTFPTAVHLADLAPSEVVESGFDGDVVYPWRTDASATGSPMVAGGRTYGRGLGVHSRSRLSWRVPAGVAHFWSRVGIDDSVAGFVARAHAEVRVLVNGTARFEHAIEAGAPPRDTGRIAVQPGDTLTLEADFGRGRDLGDRVDWLLPVFLRAGG
jgi:hypothetical protein